jgi:DNA invertase Pin-like site-specific DNA recombinase
VNVHRPAPAQPGTVTGGKTRPHVKEAVHLPGGGKAPGRPGGVQGKGPAPAVLQVLIQSQKNRAETFFKLNGLGVIHGQTPINLRTQLLEPAKSSNGLSDLSRGPLVYLFYSSPAEMLGGGIFMTYGYIRVSTDKQTVENQRFEIERFCTIHGLVVEKWIEETISGVKTLEKRLLGTLLDEIQKDDLIICSELSRLGRSLFMIMSILNVLLAAEAKVWTIKDGYRLGDDIQSKVLAFAFSLSAEIERNLISQRTKEALARKKAEGKILGRRPGKAARSKLTGHKHEIKKMLKMGMSKAAIARHFGVHRETVRTYIRGNL